MEKDGSREGVSIRPERIYFLNTKKKVEEKERKGRRILTCAKNQKHLNTLKELEAEGMSKASRVSRCGEGWGVWKTTAHRPCV